jgi:hypothetical protein
MRRFVVRPSDDGGSIADRKRERTWDVVDRTDDTCVGNYDRRADARREASDRNSGN